MNGQSLKDRAITILLWVGLLGMAWSLPVMGLMAQEKERQLMESGYYYQPGMPDEWYVQQDPAIADAN